MIYIITIIEFVLGALLHFAYNVFSNPIVAVIAPVNESIFEHLKLVLYPMLFVSLLVWYRYKNKDLSFLSAIAISIIVGILSVVLIYYFYYFGLGIESLFVDIFLLLLSIFIGNMSFHWVKVHHIQWPMKISFAIMIILIILFTFWTFFPPDLPLFIDYSM
ncbi:MAG: hypothetical protein KHZ15_07685 [Coprobacillus cateniformis]|uniref:DUF6512 family protein n=1 Tax=Longibaculum muris TaxID=1796628 RepID=UPI003AB6D9B8|nr:hypothetical protein [Coprobacillus cateniformis]